MLKNSIFNIKDQQDAMKRDEDLVYSELVRIRDSCYNQNNYIGNSNMTDDNYTMYCPVNFDGRMCWDAIPAGSSVVKICPEYLVGPEVHKEVTRKCLEDGYWYTKLDQMRPWPAYLECFAPDTEEYDTLAKDIFFVGFIRVLTCLVISFSIMIFIRCMKQFQIQVHYRFFTALCIDNLFFALWFHFVVTNSEVRIDQMVISRPQCLAKCVCVVAWIMSTFFIVAHVSKRIQDSRAHPQWLAPDADHWIFTMPIIILIYLAVFYMMHAITVIAAKLLGPPQDSYIVEYLDVLKAPFVLVPMLGIHYLFVPFSPPQNDVLSKYLDILKSLLFSFLGVCITFLLYNGLTIAMRHRFTRYRRFHYLYPMNDADLKTL